MQKWEYLIAYSTLGVREEVFSVNGEKLSTWIDLWQFLNDKGGEGWEITTSITVLQESKKPAIPTLLSI